MRPGRAATAGQLQNGIPIFLDQLIRTFGLEQTDAHAAVDRISGPPGGAVAYSELRTGAELYGKDLLALDFTVDQVVRDYGDLCQVVTDLAIEHDAPFEIEEYRTLNKCLDNAIAHAVSEFSYQRDFLVQLKHDTLANQRSGELALELRQLLSTALLAFSAAKAGELSLHGATGRILERSLNGLSKAIDAHPVYSEQQRVETAALSAFSLEQLIDEAAAAVQAGITGQHGILVVLPVDPELAIAGNRAVLLTTICKLLVNAIGLAPAGGEVTLTAYSAADRVLIDLEHGGAGWAREGIEAMFESATWQVPAASSTLHAAVGRQRVHKDSGDVFVTNLPGLGSVLTISLPRHQKLT